ncbi:MAG: hypothetical protein LC620_06990, partial [Halobacteriales archaeon]|nr:hypothetical protein [Halobacteriales archaeon]
MRRWLLLVLLLALPPAAAFHSVPPGKSVHDEVTAEAAKPLGFTDKSLEALQEAVRRPDLREMKVSGTGASLVILDASGDYEPSHHCDRVPPASSNAAVNSTVAYVRLARAEALSFAQGDHAERAVWL